MRAIRGITFLAITSLLACGGDDSGQGGDTVEDTGGGDTSDPDGNEDGTDASSDGGGDATDTTDTGSDVIEPGTFGAPCVENADCFSGWCVTSDAGPVCTRTCTEDCPGGWNCVGVSGEQDVTFLCIPRQDRLCQPCALDGQCHTGYCLTLTEGQRCSSRCDDDDECPTGYACQLESSELNPGSESPQCVPINGACDCVPGKEGFVEACSVGNAEGTCFGLRTCLGSAGWGPCDAATPAPETCDGVDNNCNRLVDENLGGDACDITNAAGTCPGTSFCDGAAGISCLGAAPTAEVCNYLDDDCDGATDEAFPDVGQVCADGVGICARFGVRVCTGDGAGSVCNAQAGPQGTESCNLLDDNCDGATDDGFLIDGRYQGDTACGNCFTDCTTIFDRPNAFGVCDPEPLAPTCRMECEPSFFDLNAVPDDGCEFELDTTAIYVGKDSPGAAGGACGLGPLGTGAGNFPCQTIAQGLARAAATGRGRVIVADGLYTEQVTVANGVSLLGAYRPDTWERHLASTGTVIRGPEGAGDRKAVVAIGITQSTLVEGFVVNAANATSTGANSYAIYVRNATGQLAIRDNLVFAGLGGPGSTGAGGASGDNGVAGNAGLPTKHLGSCSSSPNNPGGAGGVRQCANPANPAQTTAVSGGKGGDSVCPARNIQEGSGVSGLSGGGAGGAGGWGHNSSTGGCSPSSLGPETGVPGFDATVSLSNDGAAGSGCSNGLGAIDGSNEWRGATGGAAGHGGHGGGGGGGGAGSGGVISGSGYDISGSGGGGGSGGCAGARGMGGTAGGASIGVFVLWTSGNKPTSPAGVPSITGNVISRNQGGPGGAGGNGGAGGDPGAGANGGPLVTTNLVSPAFCVFGGAKGGFGARGGHGGGGGGACGGVSFDILAWGINGQGHGFATNTFPNGSAATGGDGGAGGNSSNTTRGGTPGGAGTSGTIRVVN